MTEDQDKDSKDPTKKLLAEAHKRFKMCVDAERKIRQASLDDLRFLSGDQWPENVRRQREIDGRPCLTINRLPQFLRQVTNTQRQNRVSARVSPVDDQADTETAEVIQGLIRNIEYNSKADIAYDTAAYYSAAIGFAYFLLYPVYSDPLSFDQDIKIERVRNPFSIYLDPSHQEPDGSDANYGFRTSTLTKEEFKEAFPRSELATLGDWTTIGDSAKEWIEESGIRVAEYWYKDKESATLCQLKDGSVKVKSKLPKGYSEADIVDERDTEISVIKWAKISAMDVLDETEIPGSGKWLPIVKIVGDELDVDGELKLLGIVRGAVDSQRMYNYWASAETEAIALAPKAPYIGVEGQFADHPEWKTANQKNHPYLEYKAVNLAGGPAPPPQRSVAEPAVQAITAARMQAADDLKATTGIYDASLGAKSNEQTGKAILARQQQGDTSNFHFIDNVARGIGHGCRIIVDWIPHIYNTPRVLRVIGEDETHKTVMANQSDPERNNGYEGVFDLTTGKYDVICSAEPSFATKKKQAAETWVGLAQSFPPLMQVAGDLITRSVDAPYADEVADRMKKMLPPELQDENQSQEIPPQAQQAIAQLTQQNQQLTQHLEMATEEYQTEKQKADHNIQLEQTKFANAKELALIDRETQLLKIEATIDAQAAKATMEAEIQQIHAELDAIRGRQEAEHAAGLDMSAAEHGSDLQMQQAEHGSELQMQQAEHAQSIAPTESEGAE
jgi:hypothetical protein